MMMLSQAAVATKGTLAGADVEFADVSKDTRSIKQGDLYIALKGENFDGHDFLDAAAEAGAVAAMVSELQASELPQVRVEDTRLALGGLAASWRDEFPGRVIGITGSNGKTTVKEMCRVILARAFGEEKVLSTQGNLNNDIGLPMTLLALRQDHEYAVIEMGANHMGEIAYLTDITRPDVAVITNAGAAHVEGFGSLENIARGKGEIYDGLTEQGIAVINKDDHFSGYWLEKNADRSVITFSMVSADADVFADEVSGGSFLLRTADGAVGVELSVPGKHNIMNALAAAAATMALGVDLDDIAPALGAYAGIDGRLQKMRTVDGAELIDDSYNANPYSLKAAIDVLVAGDKEPWLILGDMGELGGQAASMHREAGEYAKARGVKRLFACGELSRFAVEGFGEGGQFFADKLALATHVNEMKGEGVAVLVKASRSMKMEEVVAVLMGEKGGDVTQVQSTMVKN